MPWSWGPSDDQLHEAFLEERRGSWDRPDDEEDEDRPVFDWGAAGHGGTAETEGGK